jgi:hypothetical protein
MAVCPSPFGRIVRPVVSSVRSYRREESPVPRTLSWRGRLGTALIGAATILGVAPALAPIAAEAASGSSACVVPAGLTPDDGYQSAAPQRKDLILAWTPVPGAASYEVQVSPSEDFSHNIYVDATSKVATFTPPLLALPHGAYFWRVRVSGNSCWSDDSGHAAQITRGWPGSSPASVVPADGATVGLSQLRFAWTAIPQASHYVFAIDGWHCVTDSPSFTPYHLPTKVAAGLPPERLAQDGSCFDINTLTPGDHAWKVWPLDGTDITVDGKPDSTGIISLGNAGAEDVIPTPSPMAGLRIVKAEAGLPSITATVHITDDSGTGGATLLPLHADALVPDTGALGADCSSLCAAMPTLTWSKVVGATEYRVSIATDADFTNIVRAYETPHTTLTSRELLPDNQAGSSYWWTVQACNASVCGAAAPSASFHKRSAPVQLQQPADGATLGAVGITLSWNDFKQDDGSTIDAAQYHLQVAKDCAFNQVVDDAQVDLTSYTATDQVYADGTYYWRVQALDQSGNPLAWSSPNRDVATCNTRSFTIKRATTAGQSGGTVSAPGSGLGALTVDSAARAVSRSGHWVSLRAAKAYGARTLVASGAKHEYVRFSFEGSSVQIGYCTGPKDGGLRILLDGKTVRTLSTSSRYTLCGRSYTVSHLALARTHTVVVQATGKAGHYGGKQIAVDLFRVS